MYVLATKQQQPEQQVVAAASSSIASPMLAPAPVANESSSSSSFTTWSSDDILQTIIRLNLVHPLGKAQSDVVMQISRMLGVHVSCAQLMPTYGVSHHAQHSACNCWRIIEHYRVFSQPCTSFVKNALNVLAAHHKVKPFSEEDTNLLISSHIHRIIVYAYTMQFRPESQAIEVNLAGQRLLFSMSSSYLSWLQLVLSASDAPELFTCEMHLLALHKACKGSLAIIALFCLMKILDSSKAPLYPDNQFFSDHLRNQAPRYFKSVACLLQGYCVQTWGIACGLQMFKELVDIYHFSATYDEAQRHLLSTIFRLERFRSVFDVIAATD